MLSSIKPKRYERGKTQKLTNKRTSSFGLFEENVDLSRIQLAVPPQPWKMLSS
jgi:hypothetical protein